MKLDVVCVGSALLDVYLKSDAFVKVPSGDFAGGVALCEEYGGKTEVQEAEVASGGAGTNAAVSFARKGLTTALVAEMGRDLVAATIKEEMVREGVDISHLVEEESEETGISSIMVAVDGGRSVAVYRGASRQLTKSDIDWEWLKPRWLYISSLGGEMSLLEGLVGHAKTNGIQVAVNPGMSEIEQVRDWGGMELFAGVAVLLVNRKEASYLMGIDFENEQVWREERCLYSPRVTVITDGRRGGKVCADGRGILYEAVEANTVEETGAGDAFGSGFVAGLAMGKDIETAIEWGKKQAASVVQYMGAKRGLLTLNQIES
jgi:sugar/nucleoside kinase (ribokinase family)